MSDPLPSAGPAAGRTRRGRWVLAAAVGVVAVVAVLIAVLGGSGQMPGTGAGVRVPAAKASASARLLAVRSVLARRSAAIVHHRRAEFLSTVDPDATGFRAVESRMFDNLARVRLAAWSYSVASSATGRLLAPAIATRYAGTVWAPSYLALHYRLRGFDPRPTTQRQYPTFVQRDGRWFLGSLSDFRRQGKVSATDLWDYVDVHVVRRHSVLVLGPRSQLATMQQVAAQVERSIPQVSAVWGTHWARRAVVLIPATQHQMGVIDDDHGDLDQIVALTSAEIGSANGRPAPVGDRITINPQNWPKLDSLGAAVVLTHELTHVASRADTGVQTPKWLSEGFADYVGFGASGVDPLLGAADLLQRVEAGEIPAHLPGDRAFRGDNQHLSDAYDGAWLACRYIADRYGQSALVRFYRQVGTSPYDARRAVRRAFGQVLHLSVRQFTAGWQSYLRQQVPA